MRGQHQDRRLDHGRVRERQVDGHLVAVEVGVEGRRDERVQADRLALDEDRLERLDAEPVQRRGAVEEHGVPVDHLLEDVEDVRRAAVDDLLGALDRLDDAALDELADDERLEQLDRHLLRQAALVQAELRPDDDDRAARVVDALAEQVLAEAALLALEHVAQGLQRAVRVAPDGVGLARVVEQRVDGLLQHPLLVAQDHLGRLDVDQALEAVVADDDAPVEVVEVADVAKRPPSSGTSGRSSGGITGMTFMTIHSGRFSVFSDASRSDSTMPRRLRASALRCWLVSVRAWKRSSTASDVEVEALQELLDGLAADLGDELVRVVVRQAVVVVADLVEDVEVLVLREQLARLDAVGRGRAGVHDDVGLVVDDLVEVLGLDADAAPRSCSGGS